MKTSRISYNTEYHKGWHESSTFSIKKRWRYRGLNSNDLSQSPYLIYPAFVYYII